MFNFQFLMPQFQHLKIILFFQIKKYLLLNNDAILAPASRARPLSSCSRAAGFYLIAYRYLGLP
jgi:hypothetical protein